MLILMLNGIPKAALMSFYAILDRELRAIDTSCQKGCDACCYQPVYTDVLEALYVGDYLERLPRKQFDTIREAWGKWFDVCSNLDLFLPEFVTIEQKTFRDKKYFDNHVKCPFLFNKECSIYTVRPIVCRAFFSKAPQHLCMNSYLPRESILLKDRKAKDMQILHMQLHPNFPLAPVLLPGFLQELFS